MLSEPKTLELAYTRQNPSPRYTQLVTMYQQMHQQGSQTTPAGEMFSGISLAPQGERIAALIKHTGARSLLDYGCGKGMLYRGGPFQVEGRVYAHIKQLWPGIQNIALYDPAFPPFMTLPQGKFDAVICTDVMEHCPEEDLPWILAELFGYANQCVFANIACYPARKTMPNGENAHCTVQPPLWWKALIERIAGFFPQVQYQFVVTEILTVENGERIMRESSIQRLSPRQA